MELRVRHAPAYVVLGEPGAGKTLLLRALAWQMARAAKPLLPVVIPLREWIVEGGRKGLLSFAAADLSMRLSETVSEEALKGLAERGDVCLLVDGLDEVVAPEQRTFVRDAIVALASQYERMPMVCTSRITGYRDAPLPDTFAELTIEPLSDEELEDFARRWFANQFPGDPREREMKRSLFVSALHAEPRAKELARNPLLATLIAMVHVGEGVLPAERARLYELLVHLLVETWPQTSRRIFHDDARLTFDRQRRVLEGLAFEMQMGRGADSAIPRTPGEDESARDVLIERHALEAIAKREIADLVQVDDPTAEGIARRWVDFVAGGLGVLVERSAGLFGFVHLSLLEYMAGNEARRRWSKSGEPELAPAMVDAAGHAHHVEMVLLMLGDRNTPRTLADAVVSGVANAEFGLRALREDVDLSHAVVERVLDRAVERVLQRLPGSVDLDQADRFGARVEQANRFSRRHRDVIRRHMELRLTSSESINFLAAFRVAGPTLQKLAERRPDWRSSPSKSGMDVHAVYASLDRQDAQPVNALSSSWALARHRLGPILACRFGSAAPVLAVCAWLSEHDEQDSRFDAMDALPRSTAPLAAVLACRPVAHLYEDELHSVVSFAVGRTATTGQGATHTPEIARYTAAQVVRNVASAIMSEFQRSIARSERASKSAVTGFDASPIVQKLVVGVTEKKDASSDLVTSAQAVSGVVQTASGELRRRLDAMPATVDGAHDEFFLRELVAPSLPPILQAVHTQCVLSTIAAVHRGHIDSNRFDRELTWRLSALWACWSHEGIAKYVLGLEGNVPAARAKIAAYAVLSRTVLGEWPISAWLDTWRAAGEPKSWDERYVWWLCEAFDDPEDGTRIARARAVLAEAVAKEPDVNTREVAEWLQNIDLHPMTRAEAEEAQREGVRRWAEEVAQYGDAGWGWLLGDGVTQAT